MAVAGMGGRRKCSAAAPGGSRIDEKKNRRGRRFYILIPKECDMYPISIEFEEVEKRITCLIDYGFYAEALLVSFFTLERIIRRTLKHIIVKAGFTSGEANTILHRISKFDDYKKYWKVIDNNGLPAIIVNDKW